MSEKAASTTSSVVDEVDAGAVDGHVVVAARHDLVDEVGDRAGGLDAGGAGPDDDEVQRALVDECRLGVGVLEDLEQP